MRGVVICNAYYQTDEIMYQPRRLREEFSRLGVKLDILSASAFPFCVEGGALRSALAGYDFLIFWDKDKYLLAAAEAAGIPTFNGYFGVTACDDKMLTFLALADHGIPMPKTLPGLLCYRPEKHVLKEAADRVEAEFGYPLVVKESYGSLGRGEYLVHDRTELVSVMEEVRLKPHLFQEFIAESAGRDLRVVVVGERVLGGMVRTSGGDFRSNLARGGKAEAYPVDEGAAQLSLKIARLLRLDYCGIDYLFGKDGLLVCEVNSNAFFQGFEGATGVNVAGAYAEHILAKLAADGRRAER